MERKLTPKEEMALDLILKACEMMQWKVALPSEEAKPLYYMIIGTDEGIEIALKRLRGDIQ